MGERAKSEPAIRETLVLMRGLMEAARPSEEVLTLMQRLELTLPQILSMSRMRQGAQTVSSLAAELRLTPSAVSRLVDGLVAKRLVVRVEGEADRRCKSLSLTPLGRRTIGALDDARERGMAGILSSLDDGLRTELESVLRRVLASLPNRRAQQPEQKP